MSRDCFSFLRGVIAGPSPQQLVERQLQAELKDQADNLRAENARLTAELAAMKAHQYG